MHKKALALITCFAMFVVVSKQSNNIVRSATSDHIVISEIQIASTTAGDEFVELYNPTNTDINIAGWRLTRKTSSGTESNLVASFADPTTIPAYGFLLVSHGDYTGTVAADVNYSATTNSISADNTVLLYQDAGVTLVDKVGMGTAIDVEGTATANPATGNSVERLAKDTSTLNSMTPGGLDIFEGNGQDTDNNSADFVEVLSHPQNSASMPESMDAANQTVSVFLDGSFEVPEVTTTGNGSATVALNITDNTYHYALQFSDLSATQSGAHIHGFADDSSTADVLHDIGVGTPAYGVWTYTEDQEANILDSLTYFNVHSDDYPGGEIRGQVEFTSPSPTTTPSPTDQPTPSPSPTDEPTPSPTEEPTPTPTQEVTPTPTEEVTPTPTQEVTPTPTEEVTPTPTQEPTPEPTDKPGHGHGHGNGHHYRPWFRLNTLRCETRYLHFWMFGRHIRIPHVTCR